MTTKEAKKSIREIVEYIINTDDKDVIEGYAVTFDYILESYAKQRAIDFLDWVEDHLNKEPDDYILISKELYDKWQSKQATRGAAE